MEASLISTFNGDLGVPTNTLARAEQSKLGQGLLGRAQDALWANLCLKNFGRLIEAIAMFDGEKRDLVNVAMLA